MSKGKTAKSPGKSPGSTIGRTSVERCPICEAPAEPHSRPFCSTRCKDEDLGRWLRGHYRIPTDERPNLDSQGPDSLDPDTLDRDSMDDDETGAGL